MGAVWSLNGDVFVGTTQFALRECFIAPTCTLAWLSGLCVAHRRCGRALRISMTPPHRVGLDGDVDGFVPSWIGYEHPDRLISYPDVPYLSGYACVRLWRSCVARGVGCAVSAS